MMIRRFLEGFFVTLFLIVVFVVCVLVIGSLIVYMSNYLGYGITFGIWIVLVLCTAGGLTRIE